MEHLLPEWIRKLYLGAAVMQGAYMMLVSTLVKTGKGNVLASSLILAG